MDWIAVNAFLDSLPAVSTGNFSEWWEQHWQVHRQRCLNAAKQQYIMEKCCLTALSESELRSKMENIAAVLELDTEEFMYFAWPRAVKMWSDVSS